MIAGNALAVPIGAHATNWHNQWEVLPASARAYPRAGYSGDGGPATSAELYQPVGVTVDGAGNLYIADFFNQRIRKVNTSGTITTVTR